MILIIVAVCVTCILNTVVQANLLGGKKAITLPPNEDVVGAAKFATEAYSSGATFNVVSGTEQMVAGSLFDLFVAITVKGTCKVHEVVVGQQAWATPQYTLYSSKETTDSCP